MKRNWMVIAFTFLLTMAVWAQTATPTPKTDEKTQGCACCNHDMKDMKADAKGHDHAAMDHAAMADAKGHDHAAMDHAAMAGCCGKAAKDGMACARKDAKGGCCGGMKKDATATPTADTKACGKDCCKDGKCEMAKNGKKCCEKCPGMAEGK
jgi:uncharacterized protein involved in copper resistance